VVLGPGVTNATASSTITPGDDEALGACLMPVLLGLPRLNVNEKIFSCITYYEIIVSVKVTEQSSDVQVEPLVDWKLVVGYSFLTLGSQPWLTGQHYQENGD